MSLYWTTECIPIGVTSLLPILLYPLMGYKINKLILILFTREYLFELLISLGIMTSKAISRGYFQVI
jgi:hypothetical protein